MDAPVYVTTTPDSFLMGTFVLVPIRVLQETVASNSSNTIHCISRAALSMFSSTFPWNSGGLNTLYIRGRVPSAPLTKIFLSQAVSKFAYPAGTLNWIHDQLSR